MIPWENVLNVVTGESVPSPVQWLWRKAKRISLDPSVSAGASRGWEWWGTDLKAFRRKARLGVGSKRKWGRAQPWGAGLEAKFERNGRSKNKIAVGLEEQEWCQWQGRGKGQWQGLWCVGVGLYPLVRANCYLFKNFVSQLLTTDIKN